MCGSDIVWKRSNVLEKIFSSEYSWTSEHMFFFLTYGHAEIWLFVDVKMLVAIINYKNTDMDVLLTNGMRNEQMISSFEVNRRWNCSFKQGWTMKG